ncbi:MAG: CBS domain-containing protein [Chloroflexi bacterium]|nr:CBS domain-containing protein [Chloroflexota bacterium]
MKIANILSAKGMNVFTVAPNQLLREAIHLLVQHNVGALVVAEKSDKPIGIITERDVVRAAAGNENFFAVRVGDVMTKDVITAAPEDDVKSVGQTMTTRRFRHMPILDRGKMVGIISIGDVLKAQLEEYEGLIETLNAQIAPG